MRFYYQNSLERQAELSALVQSINLAKKLEISQLVTKFKDNYSYIANDGYVYITDCPAVEYIEKPYYLGL